MGIPLDCFVVGVDSELICPICKSVLDNPVQASNCEHTFCNSCIIEWLKFDSICPIDRNFLNEYDLKPVPRIVKNILNNLPTFCNFKINGCPKIMKFESLVSHIKECEFDPLKPIICDKGCGFVISKSTKGHNCFQSLRNTIHDQAKALEYLNNKYVELKQEYEVISNDVSLLKSTNNSPSDRMMWTPTTSFESFNYAPSPDYSVVIHRSDLRCLKYGQYLNDNIINFYLNYVLHEKCTPEQRQKSHLFNVFFNIKLQGLPASEMTDTPDTRHARVAKWTKKVDIFDKDFIIVPISEAQHWVLAIVCFPWMVGMISYDSLFGSSQRPSEIPKNNSQFATINRIERMKRLQIDKNIDPKPCILLFDSLQYQSRAPNVKLIREYLTSEWDAKRKTSDGPLVFDKNTIRGYNPHVPQQSNIFDGGIYVLHFLEMFFQHPLLIYTKEYFNSYLAEWFDKKAVEMKREFIQNLLLIKGEAEENTSDNNEDQSETLFPHKFDQNNPDPDIEIL